MNAKVTNRCAWIVVLSAILSATSTSPLWADKGIDAITKGSQDVILSFDRPGRLVELPVKEGDTVKAGQLVARQDDSEEQAAASFAKITAEDDTTIKAEEAVLEQKRVDYENLLKSTAGSTYEKDQAKLEVTVEEAKVTLQKFQQAQNKIKYDEAKAPLAKTRLFSPIDGVVQETRVQIGESVDVQNMKVIRIVKLDPLWIDVAVPFAQAEQLKLQDQATVTLSNKETRPGHVIHVAAVADSASDTLLVRVEVANADQRKAGERVQVTFPGTSRVASVDNP
jgi:RND family efflux transporter MFP subunit